MPLGSCVRSSFNSALTATQGYFNDPKAYPSNFKHPCLLRAQNVRVIDKFLKMLVPTMEAIEQIAKLSGASEPQLKGIRNTREIISIGRNVLSFGNAFYGIIPALVGQVKAIIRLIGDLKTRPVNDLGFESPTVLKVSNNPKYTDFAVDTKERICALISNIAQAIASASFIGAFVVCKPAAIIHKHITPLGPTGQKVGEAFHSVLTVNHGASIIAYSASLVYLDSALERQFSDAALKNVEGKSLDEAEIYRIYHERLVDNFLGLGEKTLELFTDIAHHTKTALPPAVGITANLAIGLLGLIKVCREKYD